MPRSRDLPCSKCGTLMWRGSTSLPVGRATCLPCRRSVPHKGTEIATSCPSCGQPARPGRSCSQKCAQASRSTKAAMELVSLTCGCGVKFRGLPGTTRIYCDPCREDRRRDHYRRKSAIRRAARWGMTSTVTGERIMITALGKRCSWTCGRCGEFVNRDLAYPDPWMPSFGHVIPISKGGLDSWDNLRLEHLTCNVKAGNR